jgi:hypothetical protein
LPRNAGLVIGANNLRYVASGALVVALILLGPIIAFVVVIVGEMLADLATKAGAPVVWPVAARSRALLYRRRRGIAHTPASALEPSGTEFSGRRV